MEVCQNTNVRTAGTNGKLGLMRQSDAQTPDAKRSLETIPPHKKDEENTEPQNCSLPSTDMNDLERIAYQWLRSNGYDLILYEHVGPADFVVKRNGRFEFFEVKKAHMCKNGTVRINFTHHQAEALEFLSAKLLIFQLGNDRPIVISSMSNLPPNVKFSTSTKRSKVKKVDSQEALEQLAQVYVDQGLKIVHTKANRVEAYDGHGLVRVAEVILK